MLYVTQSHRFYVALLIEQGVGLTFNIFSYDAASFQCRVTALHVTPKSHDLCCTSNIVAVGQTFNVFSYDAVWTENWTHHLPNAGRMRYLLRHRRGLYFDIGSKNDRYRRVPPLAGCKIRKLYAVIKSAVLMTRKYYK